MKVLGWYEEPFRVFFPLAVLLGVLGVSMWPLYFSGFLEFYPGMNHSRMMAFGFFGGFMMGFLLTALPRLADASRFQPWELWCVLVPYLGVSGFHFLGWAIWGAGATVAWIVIFVCFGLRRLLGGADCLPPGFCLVGMGLLCALLGAGMTLIERWHEIDPRWLLLRQLLQFQGFLLLPVMGVGGFILPRILGLPEHQDFPSGRRPTSLWWRHLCLAMIVGCLVLATFVLEVWGLFRWAYGLRFLIVAAYLTWLVPWHAARERGHFVQGLQLGLGSLIGGLLLMTVFPAWRVAFVHLTLGVGLVLVTLVVASRVVLGHGERLGEMRGTRWWFVGVLALVVVGVTSRMIGDMLPRIMVSHYNYGALFFALGILYWGKRILRAVRSD